MVVKRHHQKHNAYYNYKNFIYTCISVVGFRCQPV